jgi:hypothetical protein
MEKWKFYKNFENPEISIQNSKNQVILENPKNSSSIDSHLYEQKKCLLMFNIVLFSI